MNISSSFLRTRNWPSTTYALSNPLSASLPDRTGPIPASSETDFSPMGSLTKFLCFCDVELMILREISISINYLARQPWRSHLYKTLFSGFEKDLAIVRIVWSSVAMINITYSFDCWNNMEKGNQFKLPYLKPRFLCLNQREPCNDLATAPLNNLLF